MSPSRPLLPLLCLLVSACASGEVDGETADPTVPVHRYLPKAGVDGGPALPEALILPQIDGAVSDGTAAPSCNTTERLFDGHCYAAPGYKWMSYRTASDLCKAMGGQVVSINSAAEEEFVFQMLPAANQAAWIGLMRTGPGQSTFDWENGDPLTYVNWAAGEPNNDSGEENCTVIWGPNLSSTVLMGTWNDVPCMEPGRDTVICERVP